ncbi:hypothetical protein [uncultured Arcobacter sp.]|uniref:hypothetical protein n=1 Tax=uncultured Arcobacter sp. TaxID=165434 RepID=UPI00262BD649|nr:hypothetical protein [uncultured Arcobacter sp.]
MKKVIGYVIIKKDGSEVLKTNGNRGRKEQKIYEKEATAKGIITTLKLDKEVWIIKPVEVDVMCDDEIEFDAVLEVSKSFERNLATGYPAFGKIYNDKKGRFTDGTEVRTSPVTNYTDSRLYTKSGTVYKLKWV